MVKNESKYLGSCLEALQPLRNGIESELIIVDTGSTDDTIEIARKYTHKVYFHTWNNDFAAMRNITVSYAKGQWLFVLDADEIMQDAEGIIKFFKSSHCKKYNVGMVKIKNYSKGKEEFSSETPAARLFKNEKEFRYEGAIHEQPTIKPPVYVLDTVLLHYGYDSADKDLMERKFIRNTEIIKKELEIDPENFYMWFQLSQSYAMYNDDKEATKCAEKAYEIGKAKEGYLGNRMYIYSQLTRMYYKMKQYEKLERACEDAINERDGYIDFYCMLGNAKQMLSKNEEAIESYQKYLKLYHDYERSPAASDNASVTYMRNMDTYEKIHVHLAALYLKQKEYSKALEYVYKIQSKDILKLALPTLISSYLVLEELDNLQDYYCKNILIGNEELKYPFEVCLEQHKKEIQEEEWQNIFVSFSKVNTEYGILNQIRLKDYMNQDLEKQDVDLINQLDFNSLPEFYGEIIYRLLKRDYSISEITSKIRESKLISIFQYLANQKIQDLLEVILHYFKNSYPENSIEGCRIYKILGRILLVSGQCSEQDYDAVFYRYVQEGIRYIGYIYHPHLIQQNKINFAKNDEDAFFMLMNYVQNIEDTKELEQIRILKIALEIYPDMKTGIGIFLQNIQQRMAPSYEQMKEYQLQFKANVEALIMKGDLSQAKQLLEEYKKSMQIDKDIFVFEANIALIEEDYDKAEKKLKTGLLYHSGDFDLLCNAAYLCQRQNKIEQAISLYKQALDAAQNPEEKEQIQQIIAKISPDKVQMLYEKKEEIVQEPEKEFESHKLQIKQQINRLVAEGDLTGAKTLIEEYEKIVQQDIDILSMKAMIAIMEEDFKTALGILGKAEQIDDCHFDILCNLGYLYESMQYGEESLGYYKRALMQTDSKQIQDQIKQKIVDIESRLQATLKRVGAKTSIIILTYNNLEYNKICIESIRNYTKPGIYEIIVVDNHSTDGTVEWLKQQENLKTIFNEENVGFPKGCNQGIEIAEKGNDILLLNNDVIVMPNWLENLQKCLHSSKDIGAVGAITNSCSNYQAISLPYNNFDDIFKFAHQNNISNLSLWEERLRLVGFCMLIKNEVVQKIGVLDERFTPGNYEDDDYSLRIRQAGYRLILCKDSFIYHFGSMSFSKEKEKYNEVLVNNRKKFIEKWGIDPYSIMDIRKDITQIIKTHASEQMRILQLDCAAGGTLLDIKNEIPTANLYGFTQETNLIAGTQHFAEIRVGGIQTMKGFSEEFFDFIISSKLHKSKRELMSTLSQIQSLLKKNASVLISLAQQVSYNKKIEKEITECIGNSKCELIKNDNENLLFITKVQHENKNHSNIQVQQIKVTKYDKDALLNIGDAIDEADLAQEKKLVTLLRRIENEIELDKNLLVLSNAIQRGTVDENKIVKNIIDNSIDKEKMLNLMAAIYTQQELTHKALLFLKEAYKMNSNNLDTVYNIALIIYQLGDKETALKYIENVDIIDGDLLELKQEIMEAKL